MESQATENSTTRRLEKPRPLVLASDMDGKAQAKKLRDRAEECRRLAELMGLEGRGTYLRLAEAYEPLADQEEAFVRSPADIIR